MSEREDALEHLETLHEDIKALVGEARDTVDGLPDRLAARAKAYWLAQLVMALDDDHEYLGSGSCTLADTIRELREAGEPGADPEPDDQG
jgi:hypothetical protein